MHVRPKSIPVMDEAGFYLDKLFFLQPLHKTTGQTTPCQPTSPFENDLPEMLSLFRFLAVSLRLVAAPDQMLFSLFPANKTIFLDKYFVYGDCFNSTVGSVAGNEARCLGRCGCTHWESDAKVLFALDDFYCIALQNAPMNQRKKNDSHEISQLLFGMEK